MRIPISFDTSKTTSDAVGGWEATVKEISGKTVTISITSEPDSNIGKYELYVQTKLENFSKEDNFTVHEHDGYIYMLFNPWCKGLYGFGSLYIKGSNLGRFSTFIFLQVEFLATC